MTIPAKQEKELKYNIFLGTTKIEKGLIYDIEKAIKITKGLIYSATPWKSITKSLKYSIPTTPSAKTKELKYNLFLGNPKIQKSLQYLIIGEGGIQKSLCYKIKTTKLATKALYFDGSNDYINCGNDPSLDITDAITIEAWVKTTNLAAFRPVVDKFAIGYYGYRVHIDSIGRIRLGKANNAGAFEDGLSNAVVTAGVFQHIVVSKSGTTVNFYRNGVSCGSDTYADAEIRVTTANFHIGEATTSMTVFNGSIDGVKIYNRALSVHDERKRQMKVEVETHDAETALSANVSATDTIINVASATGFSADDHIRLGSTNHETKKILSINGNEITLTSGLDYDHLTGDFVKRSDLALYLKFDEGSGDTANDSSVYENHSTLSPTGDGPKWINGKGLNLTYSIKTIPSAITKSLKYNIFLGSPKIQKTLIYKIKHPESIAKELIYLILKESPIGKFLKYTIVITPAKIEKQLRYDIFLGTFSKTKELGYYIRKAIDITKGLIYKVLPSIKIEKSLQYNCVPATRIQKSLKYTVITTPTKKTKFLRYDIFLGATAIQKALKYCCIATPAKIEKSLRYDIFLGETAIQKGLIYKTLVEYYIPLTLKYTVLPSATAIQKSLKYTTEITPTAITKGLVYSILTIPTGITKSLRYAILTITKIEKALQYAVMPVIAITKDLKYTIVAAPSAIEKSLKYTVIETPTALTKGLKYCVITTPAEITKSLIYDILTQTKIEKGLHYEVLSEQAITKSLKYCVITTPTAITKSLEYQITTTPSAIEKALHYEILAPVSITKDLKYVVIARTTITKELRWEVMTYPYVPFPKTFL